MSKKAYKKHFRKCIFYWKWKIPNSRSPLQLTHCAMAGHKFQAMDCLMFQNQKVTQSVTRSPIELFWTAKNRTNPPLRVVLPTLAEELICCSLSNSVCSPMKVEIQQKLTTTVLWSWQDPWYFDCRVLLKNYSRQCHYGIAIQLNNWIISIQPIAYILW